MPWYLKGGVGIFAAIVGYILVNIAILESGNGLLNLGLMNFGAGIITALIFFKELKAWPRWLAAFSGALGVAGVIFGLRWSHESLQNPAATIEVIYDLLVISSVVVWWLFEKPLGLAKTKIHGFDLWIHAYMAFLVASRLWYHWEDHWTLLSFAPVLLAVAGYHIFNFSIRIAQKTPEATRSTNVAMNVTGGLILIAISFFVGGDALSLNHASIIGVVAVTMIVYFLGVGYKNFGPKGLSSLVPALTYDGLLIFAPIATLIIYDQPFVFFDVIVTIGFIIAIMTRAFLHAWTLKQEQEKEPPEQVIDKHQLVKYQAHQLVEYHEPVDFGLTNPQNYSPISGNNTQFMANNNVIDILKKLGAVITDDHFVYTSGKHGTVYINKDALYPHTKETSMVGRMFAEVVKRAGVEVDVVVGPALGGIILSQWTAYHLSELMGKEVMGVYTEKDENKNQIFTRNYDKLVKDKKVLVVEDIVTTAGSIIKTVNAVKGIGGNVVGAGVMVNRNPNITDEDVGAHFFALGTLAAEAWDEDQVPQWLKDRPINTDVGHGKKYLQAKGLL